MRLSVQPDCPNPHICPVHAGLALTAIPHNSRDLGPNLRDDNHHSAMAHEVQLRVRRL